MPSFQENQPHCAYVVDFGISWIDRYHAFLRVWRRGETNSTETEMGSYTGTPANLNYAEINVALAFPDGDGNYKVQGVLYEDDTAQLFTPVIDVLVKANLPEPA